MNDLNKERECATGNAAPPVRTRRASPLKRVPRTPPNELPPAETGQADSWPDLDIGSRLEVIYYGSNSNTGMLQEATHDRMTLWNLLFRGMGRIILTEGDPIALVPRARLLGPSVRQLWPNYGAPRV